MTGAFAHDVYENLTVLAQMDGLNGLSYRRQIEYYRRIALTLDCVEVIERVIARVQAEATSGYPDPPDHTSRLAR